MPRICTSTQNRLHRTFGVIAEELEWPNKKAAMREYLLSSVPEHFLQAGKSERPRDLVTLHGFPVCRLDKNGRYEATLLWRVQGVGDCVLHLQRRLTARVVSLHGLSLFL